MTAGKTTPPRRCTTRIVPCKRRTPRAAQWAGRLRLDTIPPTPLAVIGAHCALTRLRIQLTRRRRALLEAALAAGATRARALPTHLVGRARWCGRRIIDTEARVRQTVGRADGRGARVRIHRAHRRRARATLAAPADAARRAAVPTHLVGRERRRGRRIIDTEARVRQTVGRAGGRGACLGIQQAHRRRARATLAAAADATRRPVVAAHLVGRARRRGRRIIDTEARVRQTVGRAGGRGARLGIQQAHRRRARATLAAPANATRRAVVAAHLVGRARRRGRRIIDAHARVPQAVGGANGQGTSLGVHRARRRRARAALTAAADATRRAVVPTHLVGRARRRGRRIIDAHARVPQAVGGANGQGTRFGVHRARGRRARATLAAPADAARRAVVPTHLVGRARRRRQATRAATAPSGGTVAAVTAAAATAAVRASTAAAGRRAARTADPILATPGAAGEGGGVGGRRASTAASQASAGGKEQTGSRAITPVAGRGRGGGRCTPVAASTRSTRGAGQAARKGPTSTLALGGEGPQSFAFASCRRVGPRGPTGSDGPLGPTRRQEAKANDSFPRHRSVVDGRPGAQREGPSVPAPPAPT